MDKLGQYRITAARFIKGVTQSSDFPTDQVLEVAVIGRSNVGKSSLINALCGQKGLARVSKTPGRTQAFNYFDLEFVHVLPGQEKSSYVRQRGFLVDLPGYGYAAVSRGLKDKWPTLIEDYLMKREQLAAVLLLVDCRRELGDEEKWIAAIGREGNLLVVLTKADQLPTGKLLEQKRRVIKDLKIDAAQVLTTALVGKKKGGVADLKNEICERLSAV